MLGLLMAAAIAAEPAPGWHVRRDGDAIEFTHNGELVTRYHIGKGVAKPYFWPLNAPGQIPVTRDWPLKKGQLGETTDHVHQKSAWFCHGDVVAVGSDITSKIKGVKGVDFWSEAAGHGIIECTRVELNGTFVITNNTWKSKDGEELLQEQRVIHPVTIGEARLIIVQIELKTKERSIEFADTKEGAFGVRVSDKLCISDGKIKVLNPKSVITNSNGKTGEGTCWGQKADWCDYSGVIDGKSVGIAIFDDLHNKHRACWHVRSYGLMAANPFGRAGHSGFPAMKGDPTPTVTLKPGETLRLRYGVLLHAGDVTTAKLAERYAAFVAIGGER